MLAGKKLFILLNVPTLILYFERAFRTSADVAGWVIQYFLIYGGALLAFFIVLRMVPEEKRGLLYNIGSLLVLAFLAYLIYLGVWGDARFIKNIAAPTGNMGL